MARKKEEKEEFEIVSVKQEKSPILPLLSIDFPNEGLNNVARTINEIILHLSK